MQVILPQTLRKKFSPRQKLKWVHLCFKGLAIYILLEAPLVVPEKRDPPNLTGSTLCSRPQAGCTPTGLLTLLLTGVGEGFKTALFKWQPLGWQWTCKRRVVSPGRKELAECYQMGSENASSGRTVEAQNRESALLATAWLMVMSFCGATTVSPEGMRGSWSVMLSEGTLLGTLKRLSGQLFDLLPASENWRKWVVS